MTEKAPTAPRHVRADSLPETGSDSTPALDRLEAWALAHGRPFWTGVYNDPKRMPDAPWYADPLRLVGA